VSDVSELRKQGNNDTADLPEGFKMTELGPLPEDWEVVRLGEIAKTTSGGTPSRNHPEYFGGKIPWVKSGELNDNLITYTEETLTEAGLLNSSAKIFPKGTLLIAMYGATAGKVGILECEATTNQAICAIFPHNKILSKYLFYVFIYRRSELLNERYGGAQPNISQTVIKAFNIPLPPLSEQRAIAHVLRTVQRAKEATERVIQATRELKKSLMRYLFTYGPVPFDEAEKVPLKETEIGLIPEHWDVVRLGEVWQKPQYGFTAGATNQRVGPKFLRITDIQNSQVNWNTVPYCEIGNELLNRYRLEAGDLLFARIGATTGKSLLIRECPEAIFASYLIRVRVNLSRLLPEFLFHFTQGNLYWCQINATKGGRLKQGINIPVLSSLLVPLPPLPEQCEIVCILRAVDKKLQAEEARKQALEALFKTLLHNLMSGKVCVKDLMLSKKDEVM